MEELLLYLARTGEGPLFKLLWSSLLKEGLPNDILARCSFVAYEAKHYNLALEIEKIAANYGEKYRVSNHLYYLKLPDGFKAASDKIKEVFFSTIKPQYRKIIDKEVGNPGTTISYMGDSISFDGLHGHDADMDENSSVIEILTNVDEISVYFSYEFGRGHFARPKRVKHVPEWYSPFEPSALKEFEHSPWEEYIISSLSNVFPDFPHVDIDFDSDFGYQAIIIKLLKNPALEESDE